MSGPSWELCLHTPRRDTACKQYLFAQAKRKSACVLYRQHDLIDDIKSSYLYFLKMSISISFMELMYFAISP